MNKRTLYVALLALLCVTTLLVFSQTSSQFPELDKNGKPLLPRPMPHLVYSPADLGHSAVTLPASVGGATPNTSIIRVGDVTKMSVFVSCTQNVDLVVNVYTIKVSPVQPSLSITATSLPLAWLPAHNRHSWPVSLRPTSPAVRFRSQCACPS